MSTSTERVMAHDEKSNSLYFALETWWDFFLEKYFQTAKEYKTVVAPRVFKNAQNKSDTYFCQKLRTDSFALYKIPILGLEMCR